MRTPARYTTNLKKGIITEEMLADCLFSTNKRAKNCRDKEREYRQRYRYSLFARDKYDTEEKYRNKKNEYYAQKDTLLSILVPTCIHKEFIGYERVRVYDYEDEYYERKGSFFHENSYWDYDLQELVHFGDYYDMESPRFNYYLFYDVNMGKRSFHTPIKEEDLSRYPDLQVVEIGRLRTSGHEVTELISAQFVTKVVELIKSKKYEIVWADYFGAYADII